MKKKILITLIFLLLTAIIMVVYFGCSMQGGGTVSSSRPTIVNSSEEAEVTHAEITEMPDSKVQVPMEPQAASSRVQKDALEDESRFRAKLDESVMPRDKEGDNIQARLGSSKLSDVADLAPERGNKQDIGSMGGGMGGFGGGGTAWNAGRANREGGGGMGGYGGGMMGGAKYKSKYKWNWPAPVIKGGRIGKASSTSRPMYIGTPKSTGESQISRGFRQIPAEILNISADEIWIIAKSETPVVPATDEDIPGSGAMLAKLP